MTTGASSSRSVRRLFLIIQERTTTVSVFLAALLDKRKLCYKCQQQEAEIAEIETLLVDMTKRGEFYDISHEYFPISQRAAISPDNISVKSSNLTTTCILRTAYKCTNCEKFAKIQDETVECYKGTFSEMPVPMVFAMNEGRAKCALCNIIHRFGPIPRDNNAMNN